MTEAVTTIDAGEPLAKAARMMRGALWEDLKFDFKHFNDIERLAIVGESKWHEGMAWFCKPFTTAKVRYFGVDEAVDAREWVSQE
jgi:hypothetical protein